MVRESATGDAPGEPRRWTLEGLLPASPSVVRARHGARDVLQRWGGADDLEWQLSQLVSELATNAVLHAGTPFDLALTWDGRRLRCEVSDASPLPPRTRRYSAEAPTGRGMHLVDQLSSTWGVDRHAGGKTVWFELVASDVVEGGEPDLDAFLGPEDLVDDAPPEGPAGAGLGVARHPRGARARVMLGLAA